MDLYGLKEDAMQAAKIGGGALVGAAIAKLVIDKGAALIAPTVEEATAAGDASKGKAANKDSALRKYILPLVPVGVGVFVHSKFAPQYPLAAPGVAAGMVAVGLGRLISNVIEKPKADKDGKKGMDVADLLPGGRDSALAGLGYVYDYSLQGLGIGPGDVTRYMNGAPTQVQSLMGAPLQVQALAGLGASPNTVSVVGPMSASLM